MEQKDNQISALLEEEEPGWIVTYADLMTLLLVFFILLYSISTMDVKRFKSAVASIQISLGEAIPPVGGLVLTGGAGALVGGSSLEDLTGMKSRKEEILKNINNFIEDNKMGGDIDVSVFEGKIIVRIRGKVLFESGSAVLSIEAKPILDAIIKIISEFPEYKVNIKGHTDNVPISTTQFPSNWELSAIRSTTVLKYLIGKGVNPSRLTATGYGELLPLVLNTSDENRAINRRVEFVLEKGSE